MRARILDDGARGHHFQIFRLHPGSGDRSGVVRRPEVFELFAQRLLSMEALALAARRELLPEPP